MPSIQYYNRISNWWNFVNEVGQPTAANNLRGGVNYVLSYIWDEERYNEKMHFFKDWDFHPLIICGGKERAEDKHIYYTAINYHHLPVDTRLRLIRGMGANKKLVQSAIRNYLPSGIYRAWMIPRQYMQVAVLFYPNTYFNSTYRSRFGAPAKSNFVKHYYDKH